MLAGFGVFARYILFFSVKSEKQQNARFVRG